VRTTLTKSCCIRLAGLASFALAAGYSVTCAAAPPPPPPPAPSLFYQSLGFLAQDASRITSTGIQQQIWAIEDRLQGRTAPAASPPLSFTDEAPYADPVIDSAFAALGYTGQPASPQGPIPVKAPPKPKPETSRVFYSAWGQGFVDYESRTGSFLGVDIGRDTTMTGGVAAADMTIDKLTSANDALVLGIVATDVQANVRNADGSTAILRGTGVGGYSAYVNGPFSVDGTVKADFFNLNENSLGVLTSLGLNNYTIIGDLNYKKNMGSWWFQPTGGVSYMETVWNAASKALGFVDGTDFRVQFGSRFGSDFDWAGIHFHESLTLLAYDDAIITGGTLAVALGVPMAPTDEGKWVGQAVARLEAQLTSNWSASIEGEIRGRSELLGTAGRVGVTYNFN